MLDAHERRLRAAQREKSFVKSVNKAALQPWEDPKPSNPTLQAASNVANNEQRLRSINVEPAQKNKSWLVQGLEHIMRPGAAAKSAIDAATSGRDFVSAARSGWDDPENAPSGQALLRRLSKSSVPVASGAAKFLDKSGLGQFVGGTAIDIATDPLTYVGIGPATKAVGATGAIGRRLQIAGKGVGPDLTPLSKGLSDVANKIEPVRNLRDKLGVAFNPRQVSQSIQGPVRDQLLSGIDEIAKTQRVIPALEQRAVQSGVRQFAGVDESFRKAVPDFIENLPKTKGKPTFINQIGKIRAATGPAEVKDAAEMATRSFNQDLINLRAATGMTVNQLDNYVAHRYSDPPAFVRAQIAAWRRGHIPIAGGTPPALRARALPTLADARAMGLHPIEDVAQLAASHRAELQKAAVLYKMGESLKTLGPEVVSKTLRAGWQPIEDLPNLKGYFAHPDVARKLRDLSPVLTGAPEGNILFDSIFGAATSAFKSFALATGGFHIRNLVGNLWLNQADGLWNPKRYVQAAAGLSGKMPQVELNGTLHNWDDIWRAFEDAGLPGQGVFHEASGPRGYIAAAAREARKLDVPAAQRMAQRVLPTPTNPLAPVKAGFAASRAVGERTDTLSRMASFLHHLDLGEDFATASQSVRKALFDYGDLTQFERSRMRPLIPFYAWTRNNLPRQLEMLANRPGMASGTEHIRDNAVEATRTDVTNEPTWLRESGAIPVGKFDGNEKNPLYATLNLPLYDLQFIHDPADIRAWAKSVSMMGTPFLTTPFSLATNTQLYSGQQITDTPDLIDQAMGDYLNYIKAQLGGGMGRAIVQGEQEAEAERLRSVKEEKGQQTMEPTPRVPFGTFLPFNVQDTSKQARGAILDRQKLLDQQIDSVQKKTGEAVPSVDQIQREKLGKSFLTHVKAAESRPPQTVPSQGSRPSFVAPASRGPRIAVGEASSVVKQAVMQTGVPPDWEPYMQLLMKRESSGDPTAYNKTGVVYYSDRPNELYHAQGLFQMMQPTFDQYAKKAAQKNPQAFAGGFNVWDPVQNTLAAIEYIKSRYGHPARIPGLTGGKYEGY